MRLLLRWDLFDFEVMTKEFDFLEVVGLLLEDWASWLELREFEGGRFCEWDGKLGDGERLGDIV